MSERNFKLSWIKEIACISEKFVVYVCKIFVKTHICLSETNAQMHAQTVHIAQYTKMNLLP